MAFSSRTPRESDAAFVALLRAGEREASCELAESYEGYVTCLVVRTVGVDPEVPDLVNEVFAETLEQIGRLREAGALKGWIGSIALTTARGFLRKRSLRRRWVAYCPPEALPEQAATTVDPEVSQVLSRARSLFARLPAEERDVLALRLSDAKLSEIAEIEGISLSTVKRRLNRAARRFRANARRDPVLREYLSESVDS